MELSLGGQRLKLTDQDLLGEGGEARVFRWKDLAVKVFHPVPKGDPLAARVRDQKWAKLQGFPAGLPAQVIAPVGLVTEKRGGPVGYAMQAVTGAEDFARLSQRSWRQGVVPNAGVSRLFERLADTLTALHQAQVVAGDLNDGNVLFRGDEVFLIDADSMQFAGLPCPVGHERFLDPRLYGVDLVAAPRFDAGTDWYAFTVMLFSSLLYVHPFGGTHGKLPTLLRRAEGRHSVLRPDVTVPRTAARRDVLPDDALHHFTQVFEHDLRAPPPPSVLQLPWTKCSCGLEHARAACPECKVLGPLLTRPVLKSHGRCIARIAFETRGRVLATAMQGGLRYLAETDGVLHREDGTVVRRGPLEPGQAFGLSGAATWVADRQGRVERIENGQVVEVARTSVRGVTPVLAAASSVAYRQEGEWLVEGFSGLRVGQVLEGQTWLWTGERLGLGFYRAGGFTLAFLLRTGHAGLKRLEGVTWTGRVVDAHAIFDARHALLTVVTETQREGDGAPLAVRRDRRAARAAAKAGSAATRRCSRGGWCWRTDAGLTPLKRDGAAR